MRKMWIPEAFGVGGFGLFLSFSLWWALCPVISVRSDTFIPNLLIVIVLGRFSNFCCNSLRKQRYLFIWSYHMSNDAWRSFARYYFLCSIIIPCFDVLPKRPHPEIICRNELSDDCLSIMVCKSGDSEIFV